MHFAIIIVYSITILISLFVCSVLLLVIVEAKKINVKSESESLSEGEPGMGFEIIPPSDNEDEGFGSQHMSLKYFQRSRSSLTELYMKSFSYSETSANSQVFIISQDKSVSNEGQATTV